MEMRKFEINYAKIGGEQGRAREPRFKMQFGDRRKPELGAWLREWLVEQLHPTNYFLADPLRPFQTVILRSGATPKQ